MSQSLGFITHMIKSFIDDPRQFLHLPRHSSVFLYILPLLLGDWYMRRNERSISIFDTRFRHVFYLVILLADLYFLAKINFGSSQFIYFQF
jgi:hypothetical protein